MKIVREVREGGDRERVILILDHSSETKHITSVLNIAVYLRISAFGVAPVRNQHNQHRKVSNCDLICSSVNNDTICDL